MASTICCAAVSASAVSMPWWHSPLAPASRCIWRSHWLHSQATLGSRTMRPFHLPGLTTEMRLSWPNRRPRYGWGNSEIRCEGGSAIRDQGRSRSVSAGSRKRGDRHHPQRKPAGVLIGFGSKDYWLDYRLENGARFLRRVDQARKSLRGARPQNRGYLVRTPESRFSKLSP